MGSVDHRVTRLICFAGLASCELLGLGLQDQHCFPSRVWFRGETKDPKLRTARAWFLGSHFSLLLLGIPAPPSVKDADFPGGAGSPLSQGIKPSHSSWAKSLRGQVKHRGNRQGSSSSLSLRAPRTVEGCFFPLSRFQCPWDLHYVGSSKTL